MSSAVMIRKFALVVLQSVVTDATDHDIHLSGRQVASQPCDQGVQSLFSLYQV